MRLFLAWLIGIPIILYGLIRAVGSFFMIRAIDGSAMSEVQQGVDKVAAMIAETADIQIVPFTVTGYFVYVAILGTSQIIGTVATLFRQPWGLWVMGVYFALFGAGFVNFQLFNIKTGVLAVSIGLYLIMLWLLRMGPWAPHRAVRPTN